MNAQRRNPLGCLLACGAVVVGGIIVLLVGVVIWIMLGSSPMFDDSEDPRFDNPVTFDLGGGADEDGESDDDSADDDSDGDGSGGEDAEDGGQDTGDGEQDTGGGDSDGEDDNG